jgi:hypothetical protein
MKKSALPEALQVQYVRMRIYANFLRTDQVKSILNLASTCKCLWKEMKDLVDFYKTRKWKAKKRWIALCAKSWIQPLMMAKIEGNAKHPKLKVIMQTDGAIALAEGENHYLELCKKHGVDPEFWRGRILIFAARVGYEAPFFSITKKQLWISERNTKQPVEYLCRFDSLIESAVNILGLSKDLERHLNEIAFEVEYNRKGIRLHAFWHDQKTTF